MISFCRYVLVPALSAALLLSCKSGGGAGTATSNTGSDSLFPMVSVPQIINDNKARVDYLTEHFWDRFNALEAASDSSRIKGIPLKDVEESVSLWAGVAKAASPEAVEKSVSAMPSELLPVADNVLYNPNSPVRNEEIYLALLQDKLAGEPPDETMRQEYERRRKLCSLNRPGAPASDFVFLTREGRLLHLFGVDAPVLLMIFSNPGCPLCARYQENLMKSKPLSEKIDSGELKILNIYPDDDVAAWEEYVRTYPSQWICGRDPMNQLFGGELYSLRAIPSIYLLDADKKVILKDASYEEAEMKLYDMLF